MNPTPYIGVTGFTTSNQVMTVTLQANQPGRLIMCGVVLSKARIRGEQSDMPNRYPPVEDIPGIFNDQKGCLNIIHFRPEIPDAETLVNAMALGGPNCHGIQVNTTPDHPWPEPQEIIDFRKSAQPKRVVLQITRTAISQKMNDAQRVAQACTQYGDYFTDLLVDQSGGTGDPRGLEQTLQIAKAISDACPNLTVGIAGGLSHQNVAELVRKAAQTMGHQRFSIDAEGALRDDHDQLDTRKAVHYVKQAMHALPQAGRPTY